jgi:predicted nucleotidyltransferase
MSMVRVSIDRDAIARACERYGVERLRLFGSAVTDRFDPNTSDLDVLVDFRDDAPTGVGPFMGLKDELEQLTGREVDLVEARAVRNPYFARRAFGDVVDLYER